MYVCTEPVRFAAADAGQLTPRLTPPDAVAEVEGLVAAGLIVAIFSVMGPGIKQLAAVSAAELPPAVPLNGWTRRPTPQGAWPLSF